MVGTDDQDNLLEALKEVPHEQTVIDLQIKGEKLQMEVNQLKDEKKANAIAATKRSNSLDLIRKIEGYVQQPAKLLNKARLFDEGLAKNPVTAAKVILVLIDFNHKNGGDLLQHMRSLQGVGSPGIDSIESNAQHLYQHRGATNTARVGHRDSGTNIDFHKVDTTTSFQAS